MVNDWTEAEFAQFVKLVEAGESRDQLMRIKSRIEMPLFIKEHTREKCDRMFTELLKQDKKKQRRS